MSLSPLLFYSVPTQQALAAKVDLKDPNVDQEDQSVDQSVNLDRMMGHQLLLLSPS